MARRGYVQLVFQSTLPLRGATAYRFSIDETLIISIHTPLAGSDCVRRIPRMAGRISIHTPLAGSDTIDWRPIIATIISIHTPLAGSDCRNAASTSSVYLFQSTLPLRGATDAYNREVAQARISIHTPLAGSDWTPCAFPHGKYYFNPHSPCGERLILEQCNKFFRQFQSTLPLRGATNLPPYIDERYLISIHTPLAGSDRAANVSAHVINISIHTPLAGSDRRNETFLTK